MITRYLRYCEDQHVYLNLLYRLRSQELKILQKTQFCLKLLMRDKKGLDLSKCYHNPSEKDWLFGLIDRDPAAFGNHIKTLIPCLDGDLSEKERRDFERMRIRFIDVDDLIFNFNPKEITKEILGQNWPLQMSFFPTEEVQHKLVLKMIQAQNNMEQQLWQGFRIQFQVPIDDNLMINQFNSAYGLGSASDDLDPHTTPQEIIKLKIGDISIVKYYQEEQVFWYELAHY